MMFPDFVQNHSRKVPKAREHVFKLIQPCGDHQEHRQISKFRYSKNNLRFEPVNKKIG